MNGIDVEAIRKRHEYDDASECYRDFRRANIIHLHAHDDRAALLTLLPAESTGIAQVGVDFEKAIAGILQDLLELPDRTSPEDWPEACLVEVEEMEMLLRHWLIERPAEEALLRTKAAPATRLAGAFQVGQSVRKTTGYKFEGTVLGTFEKRDGSTTFVNVEHDDGWVMHFREKDLESTTPPVAAADGATTRMELLSFLINNFEPSQDRPLNALADALIAAGLVTVSDGAKP
jgi:hypothetical protein